MDKIKRVVYSDAGVWLTLVFLAASLALNVVLARRLQNGVPRPRMTALALGSTLAGGIPVVTPEGKSKTLTFPSDRPTIVYIFSPQCGFCMRNQKNLVALLHGTESKYAAVLLSVTASGLSQYINELGVSVPLYVINSKSVIAKYHFGATPQTILIGTDSAVKKVWLGALTASQQAEVEKYFSVRLPGLSSAM